MFLNALLLSSSRSWHDRNVPNSRGPRGQLALGKDSAPQPRENGDLSRNGSRRAQIPNFKIRDREPLSVYVASKPNWHLLAVCLQLIQIYIMWRWPVFCTIYSQCFVHS